MQAFVTKFSLRELYLVLVGVGVTTTALLFITIALPHANAFRAAANEVADLETAAIDGAELERLLAEKKTELEDLEYRLHGDMADLPPKQVEAYIIGRLQRVSWNNNVEFVSVEPATGDRVQIFQETLFNVELVGHYEDLYRWLWEARKDLGYVVIKEYALTRRDGSDVEPRLLANLSLATYRAIE